MRLTKLTDGRPQCVICDKVLPNNSMFPAKPKRHFETYSNCINKTADYFKRKSDELQVAQKSFVSRTHNEIALKPLYLVCYKLDIVGKLHILTEILLKLPLVKVFECIIDENSANLISGVPVSNNTVRNRIMIYHMMLKTSLFPVKVKTNFHYNLTNLRTLPDQLY